MPQEDSDTSDERLFIRHTITRDGNTTSLDSRQVRMTDDDDGEALVGSRPADALWWAALTARRTTDGVTGYLGANHGKVSGSTFTHGGVTREIDGVYVSGGRLNLLVDSGDGSRLPDSMVLHVGDEELILGSASTQAFETTYNDGSPPNTRDHAYRWYSVWGRGAVTSFAGTGSRRGSATGGRRSAGGTRRRRRSGSGSRTRRANTSTVGAWRRRAAPVSMSRGCGARA